MDRSQLVLKAFLSFFLTLGLMEIKSNFAQATQVRAFTYKASQAVAIDLQKVSLSWTFRVVSKKTTAVAQMEFLQPENGYGYFLLDLPVISAVLDGASVETERVSTPVPDTQAVVLKQPLTAGSLHNLALEYELTEEVAPYGVLGASILTSMGDLKSGNFFESYGPTGYEDDDYALVVDILVKQSAKSYRLFSNGEINPDRAMKNHWIVSYPAGANAHTPLIHLTRRSMSVFKGKYQGVEKEIPWTIYSTTKTAAKGGAEIINDLFSELESTYGPYMHSKFIALISGSGGMEFEGGAITSVGALDHELLHSWFARGVMPSDGRSGWIDEGIANWRDNDYPRKTISDWPVIATPKLLGKFSVFERFTPKNCYKDGSWLLSYFDGRFASQTGGMKPILKSFFAEYHGKHVTSDLLRDWIRGQVDASEGPGIDFMFSRYVLNENIAWPYQSHFELLSVPSKSELEVGEAFVNKHPPALTHEEINALR